MRADLDVRAHLRMYMKCIKLGNTQKWVQAMNENNFVFFFRFSKTTGSVGRWETKHFKGKTFGWSRKTGWALRENPNEQIWTIDVLIDHIDITHVEDVGDEGGGGGRACRVQPLALLLIICVGEWSNEINWQFAVSRRDNSQPALACVVSVPVRKGVSAFLARRKLGRGQKIGWQGEWGEKRFLVDWC